VLMMSIGGVTPPKYFENCKTVGQKSAMLQEK